MAVKGGFLKIHLFWRRQASLRMDHVRNLFLVKSSNNKLNHDLQESFWLWCSDYPFSNLKLPITGGSRGVKEAYNNQIGCFLNISKTALDLSCPLVFPISCGQFQATNWLLCLWANFCILLCLFYKERICINTNTSKLLIIFYRKLPNTNNKFK